jgi:hypothetical protein
MIHPKRLQRIQFHKLFSAGVINKVAEESKSKSDFMGESLLKKYGVIGDFMLQIYVDVVDSLREVESTSRMQKFFGESCPVQVWDLDSTLNPVAYERGATRTHCYLVLPHSIAQQCEYTEIEEIFEPLAQAEIKLVYTETGEVNAIE